MLTDITQPSSFSLQPSIFPPSRCGRCGDLGLWLTPTGKIEVCPRIQMREDHSEPNAAADLVARAGRSLAYREIKANPHAFNCARALTRFTTENPCPRQTLIDKYFQWGGSQSLRHLHYAIEELRSVWFLPVGSRKKVPHGYWILASEADFKEWFERTKQAPITQLSTIHRLAKANFPVFAEQMEFEFWHDVAP